MTSGTAESRAARSGGASARFQGARGVRGAHRPPASCFVGLCGMVWLLLAPGPLRAQVAVRGAEAITAPDVARHLAALTADSLCPRPTPSAGLERTARYLAAQFDRLGLRPGGDDSTWFQWYPRPDADRLDYATSQLLIAALLSHRGKPVVTESGSDTGRKAAVTLATDARFATELVPRVVAGDRSYDGTLALLDRPGVLIAGPHTLASLRRADVSSHNIIYVPPPGTDPVVQRALLEQLLSANDGVLIVGDGDSVAFARRQAAARQQPPSIINGYMGEALGRAQWAIEVWPPAVAAVLATAGVDLAASRAAPEPVVRELPILRAVFERHRQKMDSARAPNVVGVLEGSDSVLKHEYVVLSAHMDTDADPATAPGTAAACGVNDNASGTAGLLTLAQAFTQPGARPRRSLLFVALGGGAREFWGAHYFSRRHPLRSRVVLNLTLDMIGGTAGDSLFVAGLPDADFASAVPWVAAAHPELALTLVDAGTAAVPSSDQFAFAQAGVPSLYFHTSTHATERTAHAGGAVDVAQEARLLRLIFYVGHTLAEAPTRPRRRSWAERRRLGEP